MMIWYGSYTLLTKKLSRLLLIGSLLLQTGITYLCLSSWTRGGHLLLTIQRFLYAADIDATMVPSTLSWNVGLHGLKRVISIETRI